MPISWFFASFSASVSMLVLVLMLALMLMPRRRVDGPVMYVAAAGETVIA